MAYRQKFIGSLRCSLAISYNDWRRHATSMKLTGTDRQTDGTEVYIPQLFQHRGGGVIKAVHLGKDGEENWYIKTFYTFSDKNWQNFAY